MKKILLSLTLLLFAIAAFSQQFKPVKADSLVTVSLPAAYKQTDTLGQHIYAGTGTFGYMTVIVAPNGKNNTPLKKEKDLNKVLKEYITHIQSQSSGGSIQNVRDTTVGTLKAKAFTLKSDDGAGGFQFINFTLIYTQDATYTFEYIYVGHYKTRNLWQCRAGYSICSSAAGTQKEQPCCWLILIGKHTETAS